MWRWKSFMAVVLLICSSAGAQEVDTFTVISEFIGSGAEEETDPADVERLEWYIEHPLRINMANSSRIGESGLLTQYQMASLLDYRSRHGDVLSLTELSAVDGFGQDFVRRLAPFISLETQRLPGQRTSTSRKISHELEIKGGIRSNAEHKGQYALKYKVEAGDSFTASLAISKSADAKRPDALTGNLFWYFRRHSAKVAVGDFNARFGQGLSLWNGMSMSGLNKPSTYLKRSSNLSPSSSYTGNYAFRGIAAEIMSGDLRMTYMTALSGSESEKGMLPAANISWLWPNGQIGLTHYADFRFPSDSINIPDMKTSCDIATTVRGVDLFAEGVYDWVSVVTASLVGIVFPAGENVRLASMLRFYPSDFHPTYSAAARALTKCTNEYGASMSSEFSAGKWIRINGQDGFGSSSRRIQGMLCIDGVYLPVSKSDDLSSSIQLKSLAEIKLIINESLALKWRLAERVRTWGKPFHTDLRMDIFYYSRLSDLTLRANVVNCAETSFLLYTDATIKQNSMKFSFRCGVFIADNWDDRIYVYERDIPGAFNVPALYGRGFWVSLTGNWKFARWGRVYIRGSMTEYPFMEKKKPGKAELKLMFRFQI
jgi:hypothetical protein